MSALIATIIAALPMVLMRIAGKIFTDRIMQAVLEKLICEGIRRAADLSTNAVTHDLADTVIDAIKSDSISLRGQGNG